MTEWDEDPRVTADHVRTITGTEGNTVTLVGVVHDHPASKHRVRAIINTRDPAVLALELPPLALPLFRHYAADERTPPVFGGEMSAAIQAATTERVVGIDGPSGAYLRRVMLALIRERASFGTIASLGRSLIAATKTATVCRVASGVADVTSLRVEVDSPKVYETSWRDAPARQAADERRHLGRAQSVIEAFKPPQAARLRDATREAHMADRLRRLRDDGAVVAVVGRSHLDSIATRLTQVEDD